MNIKLTATSLVAALAVPVLVLANSAQATVPPSIERGDIYRVKNVTQGTEFMDPVSADKCDELQYKVRIHNPGPTEVATNVTVQAAFPTAASTKNISLVTIKADNIQPTSASDSATVNISTPQKVSYVTGSTQLLDANSNFIKNLPDAITGAGVNIGNVGVSINEKRFVQFKAKIDCPQPPEECVDNPETKEDECNPVTPPEEVPPTPEVPEQLPDTGPGAVIAGFLGITSLSSALYYAIVRRLGRF
ncbi:MAG TPA: hypothetical protein VFX86_04500 [Candidatus Saccharimonadales bacterium]|nr:hypothetical protein [Candidatus Saccharimonadales bacterium]